MWLVPHLIMTLPENIQVFSQPNLGLVPNSGSQADSANNGRLLLCGLLPALHFAGSAVHKSGGDIQCDYWPVCLIGLREQV